MNPVWLVVRAGSICTTMALTADRMLAVTFPLRWPCTEKQVKVILAACVLFPLVVCTPEMNAGYIDSAWNHERNVSVFSSFRSEFYYSKFYKFYTLFAVAVMLTSFPIITMSVLNILIVVSIRRHRTKSAHIPVTRTRREQYRSTRRITAQVLLISIFTILSRVTNGVQIISNIEEHCFDVNTCPLHINVFTYVSRMFEITNSTVNFFFYCYFSTRFRRCFTRVFWSKCSK